MRRILHIPGGTTNLGEGEHDTPHLTLVAKTIFSDELQLSVPVKAMLDGDLRHEAENQLLLSGRDRSYKRADSKGRRGTLQQMSASMIKCTGSTKTYL